MAKKKKYYGMRPMEDESMIRNDYSAPGNMPTKSMRKQYPMVNGYDPYWYNDTQSGIDSLIDKSVRNMKRYRAKDKY